MKQSFTISGMSCSGCKANTESALLNLPEVTHATARVETGSLELETSSLLSIEKLQETLDQKGLHYTLSNIGEDPRPHRIPSEKIKYKGIVNGVFYCPMNCEGEKTYDKMQGCPVCGMDLIPRAGFEDSEDHSYALLLNKMKISLVFTIPIFTIAMSEMIPGNPLDNLTSRLIWNWIQFLLTLPVVFYTGWIFFERAYTSVKTWNLNMFTLIGIGSGVAFLFSVIALLFPGLFPAEFRSESGEVFVYFEAVAVILTLVLFGQLLESKAHGQTRKAISELMGLAPKEATLVTLKGDKTISIEDIRKKDLLRIKPGGKIPVDGIISEGEGSVDESMITGEPIPVDKQMGDWVSSGTINGTHSFVMVAEKVGYETLLSQIIALVNSASASRAPIQKLVDKISRYFVPIVVLVSIITFLVWFFLGPDPALVFAFVNAIAVLIIACPCALGLATPMSVMVGVGKGAQHGILLKNAESLERLSRIDVLITDKTGTITEGKPSLEKLLVFEPLTAYSEERILELIVAINQYSEHPLAKAVVDFGRAQHVVFYDCQGFQAILGKGVVGKVEGKQIALGNEKLLSDLKLALNADFKSKAVKEQKLGKTVSYVCIEGNVVGYVTLSDAIKNGSQSAINELQKKGIEVIMLTGDNENTAKNVAETLKLSNFRAGCLPEHKLNVIKELQSKGKIVAMAGDGINDAPALAQADIGIAMGTGTDIAMDTSQITLIKGDLRGINKGIILADEVMQNIKQNLFFAFAYNVVGVPIAAGILYPFFGILLSPMIAAAAMSFSSVSVIANSLRLRKVTLTS